MMAAAPAAAASRPRATASSSRTRVQPSTATWPSEASTPTMIRSSKRRQMSPRKAGSSAARVPTMAQRAPASSTACTCSAALSPPPTSTGIFTARTISPISEIVRAVKIPVEVGGGLRAAEHVQAVLDAGARWAIVGTRAALDPAFLGDICRRFEDRIIVGVDASDGHVAVDGWTRVLELEAVALGRDAAAAGAAAIIYTDIARDGTESGPNLWSTEAVARAAAIPLFASGGVGSLDDIRQLATIPGVDGVIVGRALYSGAVDLRAAVAEAR